MIKNKFMTVNENTKNELMFYIAKEIPVYKKNYIIHYCVFYLKKKNIIQIYRKPLNTCFPNSIQT